MNACVGSCVHMHYVQILMWCRCMHEFMQTINYFVSFIAIISYAGVTHTHTQNMQVLYKHTVMLINCFVSFTGC